MESRRLAVIAGVSYIIIFCAAIFANFLALERLISEPIDTLMHHQGMVRIGILAFLFTVVFDVVVAWALYELYPVHPLSRLSTYFRLMHAAIMGVAIFALPMALSATTAEEVLMHTDKFNTIWLIGLFFFGAHLILLAKILGKPKLIAVFLALAGVLYMIDTAAHFLMPNYAAYGETFLVIVAIPSIVGEMSLAIWLLVKGGK